MKILSKDRRIIIDTEKHNLFVKYDLVNDNYKIEAKGIDNIELGEYEGSSRAEEILKEIFQYLRCKKPCYAMPEE